MQDLSIKAETTTETVFYAALDVPPIGRSDYLAKACKEDLALRQKVEDLLRAHEAPSTFLPEQPASASIPSAFFTIAEKQGDFVGPYKLVQKIGEGGFGVVYVAEQTEPIRRRVAVKIIKLGMDTRQVVARFEAERQALAMMDHPNIAKVLDAGVMATGRPYFVMEFVEGMKITEFCDNAKLSVRQRLDLFIEICEAVQHAHQKGIIHRDIKPSNILVSLQEGRPVPKVIDFGIAKATQGQLSDNTVFTGFEQFIGTPAYVSPEQAEGSGVDVDTRSDVYSLGVLLYELLTGSTPFDRKQLLEQGMDEMRRIIREQEPKRPSAFLSAMPAAQLAAVSASRQTQAAKLIYAIRGDLDWIVMRCLEKERERRYETANGLAMDIQRHLAQEPVLACPPDAAYRLRKMLLRNKSAFAIIGAVAAALLLGIVASAWQTFRAVKAEHNENLLRWQAEADERRTQIEAEKNRLANKVLGDAFMELVRAAYLKNNSDVLRSMMDQVTDQLERGQSADQPEARAYAFSILAKVYLEIDNFKKAQAMEQKAIDLERKSKMPQTAEQADSQLFLAVILWSRGDDTAAERSYQEALKLDPKVIERNPAYLKLRGSLLARHGQWEEAARFLAQVADAAPKDASSWGRLMPVLIHAGRISEYKTRCQLMLNRFGKTRDLITADLTAKSCLLLPSAVDPQELSQVADLATYSVTGGDIWWHRLTVGLAQYRQGRYAEALETVRAVQSEAPAAGIRGGNARRADALFISAMAHYRLNQPDEAGADLQRGLQIVQTNMPKPADLGLDWYDNSTTYLFLHEAEQTIEHKPYDAQK